VKKLHLRTKSELITGNTPAVFSPKNSMQGMTSHIQGNRIAESGSTSAKDAQN